MFAALNVLDGVLGRRMQSTPSSTTTLPASALIGATGPAPGWELDALRGKAHDGRMAGLKIHYDGWVKLPATLLRALGAKSGDTIEVEPREGGHIMRVYEQCDRNMTKAAQRLGMHRRSLQRFLSKRAPPPRATPSVPDDRRPDVAGTFAGSARRCG